MVWELVLSLTILSFGPCASFGSAEGSSASTDLGAAQPLGCAYRVLILGGWKCPDLICRQGWWWIRCLLGTKTG